METLKTLVGIFLHVDKHLDKLIVQYGVLTNLILFTIIFLETGAVVTPFLPGDSLLFAAGALSAKGNLNIFVLFGLLVLAAFCGDNLNYWIGKTLGPKLFKDGQSRFLKKEHLDRTHKFFEKHGGKTVIMARFVPIVRTFTPFVAGMGAMPYSQFIANSVFGAVLWVGICTSAGYFFGNLELVKQNFSLVVLAIVAISLLPVAIEYLKHRSEQKSAS